MGVYRPLHPERTVLYRVLFHYFERFPTEYDRKLLGSLCRLALQSLTSYF